MNEATNVTRESLKRGLDLLQSGKPRQAIHHFRFIADHEPVTDETITAMYLAGVILWYFGEHEISVRRLRDARKLAEKSRDARLKATTLRNIGIALQAAWLRKKPDKTLFEEAFECFLESKEVISEAMLSHDDRGVYFDTLDAEFSVSAAYEGMLYYENGERMAGRDEIVRAYEHLQIAIEAVAPGELDALELEVLILLMRVTSIWEQQRYVDRAYGLAAKMQSPSLARKRVSAAFLGNGAYRLFAPNVVHTKVD